MTNPPKSTKDMLEDVLGTMRASGGGDPTANAALAERQRQAAAARGTARAATKTTPTVQTTPTPQGITLPDDSVRRPNGELYYTRKMGIHDDIAVLRKLREHRKSMLLYGPPGNGKTALFEAAFADGFEFVPGDGDTAVSDFVGGYVPLPGGGYAWVDGPLPRAMDRGVPILVDEVALVNPKVMAVVYSVMDGRSVLRVTENPARADVISQPGFTVFGACNPNAPGARMSEALVSRFQVHAEVMVDFELMRKMGVPRKFITCVQNMKTKVEKGGGLEWFPQIREMLNFVEIETLFGLETALCNVVAQAPESQRAQIASILTQSYSLPIKTLEIK